MAFRLTMTGWYAGSRIINALKKGATIWAKERAATAHVVDHEPNFRVRVATLRQLVDLRYLREVQQDGCNDIQWVLK